MKLIFSKNGEKHYFVAKFSKNFFVNALGDFHLFCFYTSIVGCKIGLPYKFILITEVKATLELKCEATLRQNGHTKSQLDTSRYG